MKFTENANERIINEAAGLMQSISELPVYKLSAADRKKTMAVFVDIINGFITGGAMACSRVGDIIPANVRLMKQCTKSDILTVAFTDCHSKDAVEFMSFPPHCIEGTSEAMIVPELAEAGSYILIPKNSTNGFHEKKFRDLLECHPELDCFIVTGDCTDICVMQLCLTLKTYFTMMNKAVKIIIPINCVETYDAPYHSSDFANLAAYKLLSDSGITFVSSITE